MHRRPYESCDDFAERAAHLADRWQDERADRAASHSPILNSEKPMAMIGDYLLQLLERCSDQQFGQDAVQHGITLGLIKLSYNLDADLRRIFAPAGTTAGETVYDQLCETWRRECADNHARLLDSYLESGMLEEILRPLSRAQTSVAATGERPLEKAA